jgi:hypothetical protein
MFFLKKELSDWTNDHDHGYNHIRFIKSDLGKNSGYFIGLNCIESLIDHSKPYMYASYALDLKYKKINLKILRWNIFGSEVFDELIKHYNKSFNDPKYTFDQLDYAKNNIDNFIVKFDKLKVYI